MLLIASVAMANLLSTAWVEEAQDSNDNRVVYWGNMVTGASVRVVNQANAEKKAEALVKKAGGSGWVLLANSGAPGFGAAICERRGTLIQFFVSHGYATGREAVSAAKAKAGGGGTFCSNALWRVSETSRSTSPTVMDRLKGVVRRATVTPRTQEEFARDCVEPSAKGRVKVQGSEIPGNRDTSSPIGHRPSASNWKPADWCPERPDLVTFGVRG